MGQPAPKLASRQRNSALWMGLAFVLLGIFSNFLYFFNVPGQSIFPWLSLLIPLFGVAFLLLGLKRAFGQPRIFGGKVLGSILTLIALPLFALSAWGFFHARAVPASGKAPQVGQKVPDFTLSDTSGQNVSLSQLLTTPLDVASGKPPKAVLLIFYRGYW